LKRERYGTFFLGWNSTVTICVAGRVGRLRVPWTNPLGGWNEKHSASSSGPAGLAVPASVPERAPDVSDVVSVVSRGACSMDLSGGARARADVRAGGGRRGAGRARAGGGARVAPGGVGVGGVGEADGDARAALDVQRAEVELARRDEQRGVDDVRLEAHNLRRERAPHVSRGRTGGRAGSLRTGGAQDAGRGACLGLLVLEGCAELAKAEGVVDGAGRAVLGGKVEANAHRHGVVGRQREHLRALRRGSVREQGRRKRVDGRGARGRVDGEGRGD